MPFVGAEYQDECYPVDSWPFPATHPQSHTGISSLLSPHPPCFGLLPLHRQERTNKPTRRPPTAPAYSSISSLSSSVRHVSSITPPSAQLLTARIIIELFQPTPPAAAVANRFSLQRQRDHLRPVLDPLFSQSFLFLSNKTRRASTSCSPPPHTPEFQSLHWEPLDDRA